MAGLYIHIPFCGQLCTYCDFHFSVSLSRVDEMIEALKKEMMQRKNYLNGEKITTLYFGGGTPSLLSVEQLKSILYSAMRAFNFSVLELLEFTVECNPEDLTFDYLISLKEIGVSRLSIGVQSFNDNTLVLMNRRHNAERAVKAVSDARKAGFTNISIDLIFGVPGCDDRMLLYDLQQAVDLNTEHVSVYHLTIEDNTVLGWKRRKGVFSPVADEISEQQYQIVERELKRAGFVHYEISNYAKEGFEALHNGNYWNGTNYVGIGPSAHSYDGVSRQWNIAGNIRYMNALNEGTSYFEREELSENDIYNEYVMTSLRTTNGLSLGRLNENMLDYFTKESEKFIKKGLLIKKGDRVVIESGNFLLSDSIIADLYKV